MAATHNSMQGIYSFNRANNDDDVAPLDLAEIQDQALRADLERIEERIYSYTNDVLDGWLGMAEEFHKAKERLARARSGQWTRWVARFRGYLGLSTANRLAQIGEMERSELEALRNTYFNKGSGISAIAAFLAAPEPVQEQVKEGIKEGTVQPTAVDIEKAARAFKEADEARKRADEAEKRAQVAQATFEAQLHDLKTQLEHEGQIALQQATARLQREADEARHQAELRQQETDAARREIQRAQSDWQRREAEVKNQASQEERDRLEREYAEKLRKLQKQLEDQERAAKAAQKQASEISARLTHARDSEAIRARWDILASDLVDRLDEAFKRMPNVIDAQYFENHERTLVESVRRRAEMLVSRMNELSRASVTVVDSR